MGSTLKEGHPKNSQWLGLWASTAKGAASIPGKSYLFSPHIPFFSYKNDSLQEGVNQGRNRFCYKWDSPQRISERNSLYQNEETILDKTSKFKLLQKVGWFQKGRHQKGKWNWSVWVTVVLKDLYKVSSRMWSQFSKAVKHMKMIDLKR